MENPYHFLVQDQDEVNEKNNSYEIPPVVSPRSSLISTLHSEQNTASEVATSASQFPDIEKCIPRWKQVFPWICWCSEENALFCLQCRQLLKKYFPDNVKKSNVILITSSEKIFTVAKALRSHHDSVAHKATVYLFSFNNLVYLVSFFNYHYKDLKEESEIMDVIRNLFNHSELKLDSFSSTLKNIGLFIEKSLIESLKKSAYFSVVADQCRGIVILRWINEKGQIVEHVFWSYLAEWTKTPMQYLREFGVSFEKMTLYIANSLCQHCSRCQNLSVMQASLPPRLPSSVSFATILWNLDLMRPLTSLMNTINKIFITFPYKFAKKFEGPELRNLLHYSVKPYSLIKIMDSFEDIRKIAEEIYESRFYVEALGLSLVDLKKDVQHKKILILLQEIIDTVREAGQGNKITDIHIVKLNQSLGSLKQWSTGAKFVTYKNEEESLTNKNDAANKVWEFLYFVEKFIDENQKSIYYNGREQVRSFISLCFTKALLNSVGDEVDEAVLIEHFDVVYNVYTQILKNSKDSRRLKILRDIKSFHTYVLKRNECVKSCIDIIQMYHKDDNLKKKFPDAYELFLFCSTMPFQPCQVARSLFVSFVIEQRLESSVWMKMEGELKPWLLYLHHELSFIPLNNILKWWLELL